MYKSEKLKDASSNQAMKQAYLENLVAPMHAYWEHGLIGSSDHFLLWAGEQKIGYFCIQGRTLMQFHLEAPFATQASQVMDFLLENHDIKEALAATIEPHYLSLCLDRQKESEIHTLLYEDHSEITPDLQGLGTLEFRESGQDDFETICEHYSRTSDDGELSLENLKAYIKSVLNHHHLFMLFANGQLIGTGECRISQSQKPYADLGMIVHPDFRRKGVGSYILAKGKTYCYGQNAHPICCCEASNISSSKAIEKAGFIARHRVLKLSF